jgi:hypothetical protein
MIAEEFEKFQSLKGKRAIYLASAVSDFFIPYEEMVYIF